MPTFSTPEPISLTVEVVVGDVRIAASDRLDTVVRVRPSDESHEPDVRAAEQTRVDHAAGRLAVRGPKQRGLGLFSRIGSVDVIVDLPTGSQVQGETAVGAFHCVGQLGECRLKTSSGTIEVDRASTLDLNTGLGSVVVERAAGNAEVSTGSGRVRLGVVEGAAVIKNSNGDTSVGQVRGDVRVNAANGDISIGRADGDVTASSANGDVRVADAARGSASLKTALGAIEIGIRTGTAARLDVHTSFGRVHNQMQTVPSPGSSDETIDVRARTSYGDIIIRHS